MDKPTDRHFVITTAGEFEVDEDTAATTRAQFDSDRPDPMIAFATTEEPPRNIEIMYTHVIGFSTTHAQSSDSEA